MLCMVLFACFMFSGMLLKHWLQLPNIVITRGGYVPIQRLVDNAQ